MKDAAIDPISKAKYNCLVQKMEEFCISYGVEYKHNPVQRERLFGYFEILYDGRSYWLGMDTVATGFSDPDKDPRWFNEDEALLLQARIAADHAKDL